MMRRAGVVLWIAVGSFLVACESDDSSGNPDNGFADSFTPCQYCKGWEKCEANNCVFDLSSQWDLIAVSGTVSTKKSSGEAWDAFGGAPDPFVCATVNSQTRCSFTAQDTFYPSWDATVASDVGGGALMSGIYIAYGDEDISSNDSICSGNITIGESDFVAGGFVVDCEGTTSSVTFDLEFVQ